MDFSSTEKINILIIFIFKKQEKTTENIFYFFQKSY